MALVNPFGALGLDTTLQAIRDRLPAAFGSSGGVKTELLSLPGTAQSDIAASKTDLDSILTKLSGVLSAAITSVPAASRTTDGLSATVNTDGLMTGDGATLALAGWIWGKASSGIATDVALLSAVTSKKLKVVRYAMSNATGTLATVTFNSKPAGAGTAISQSLTVPANGGRESAYCEGGLFQPTNAGEALTFTVTGSTVSVSVVAVAVS